MSSIRYILICIVVATIFCSCLDEQATDDIIFVEGVDPQSWRSEDIASFEFRSTDTLSCNDISIFLRYQPQQKNDTIPLLVYLSTPDHLVHLDEMTISLNRRKEIDGANGGNGMLRRWRGITQFRERIYRRSVVWRDTGLYKIYISPATTIVGIEAVGVKIEKH